MKQLKEILNDYRDGGSTEQEALMELKFKMYALGGICLLLGCAVGYILF